MVRFEREVKFHLPARQIKPFLDNPEYAKEAFTFVREHYPDRFIVDGLFYLIFSSREVHLKLKKDSSSTLYQLEGPRFKMKICFQFSDALKIEVSGSGKGALGKISEGLFRANFENYLKNMIKKLRETAGC